MAKKKQKQKMPRKSAVNKTRKAKKVTVKARSAAPVRRQRQGATANPRPVKKAQFDYARLFDLLESVATSLEVLPHIAVVVTELLTAAKRLEGEEFVASSGAAEEVEVDEPILDVGLEPETSEPSHQL